MRAVVQRVSRAEVRVEGHPVARIGRGLVVLLGVGAGDGEADAAYLAEKIAHLRIFPDARGRFHFSVRDVGGEVLAVPNFTLYGDARHGRRPSFTEAAPPEQAEPLFRRFAQELRDRGLPVQEGVFGAHMEVELVNDGPVTLVLDSRPPHTSTRSSSSSTALATNPAQTLPVR